MKLMHYSDIDNLDLHLVPQPYPGLKPHGLWVSDEDEYGWTQYCDDIDLDRVGPHPFIVELKPTAHILTLTTADQITEFTREYNYRFSELPEDVARLLEGGFIDWPKVADTYQGILITPYQGSLRRKFIELAWYYVWDCASGCIWNPDAIESLTYVGVRA